MRHLGRIPPPDPASPTYLAQELFQEDSLIDSKELFPAGKRGQALEARSQHPLLLAVPILERDLSAWDAFSLRVENHGIAPVSVGLRLVHGKNSGQVSSTGGRMELPPGCVTELFFPVESFGSYGRPDGWRDVRRVEVLFRREKDRSQPQVLDVAVHGLRVLRRRIPQGPRLEQAGLAALLALSLEAALRPRGLLRSLATPETQAIPPPVFPYPLDTARDLMEGRVMGCQVGWPPCWFADPLGELEWRHFLHRHHFLRALANPPQAEAVAEALTDWVRSNPVPLDSDGGAGPAWQTLSVAWRLREWLLALAAIWEGADLTADIRGLLLRSVWEHARHLCDHLGHPGNWRMMEAAALSLAGLAFPEFREAGGWVAKGLTRLEQEAERQFLADGFHAERSPLYHALCCQACLEVLLATRERGMVFPGQLQRLLPRRLRTLAALRRPSGSWPSFNDSGSTDSDFTPLLHLADTALGLRTRRPVRTSRRLPQAGFAMLRAGEAWVLFKAGPKPINHAHEDDLSLEVGLGGRPLLVDPGITRYAPSAVTDAYRSAAAHSCLLVPGLTARAEGLGMITSRERQGVPGFQVAWAERRQDDIAHLRQVCLLQCGVVVVRDVVEAPSGGEIRICWRFAPGTLQQNVSGNTVEGRGFRFLALPEHSFQRVEQQPGLVSLSGRDVPAPGLVYDLETEARTCLWWVLTPGGTARRHGRGIALVLVDGASYSLQAEPWSLSLLPDVK